ncbi:MAG TPA: hypothetical protein VF658_01065 [Pyrinomonadaceae bacterium]
MRLKLLQKLVPLVLLVFVTVACGLMERIKQEANKSKKPTVLTSADGRYQLTIPGDWREDSALLEEAILKASNRVSELYVVVLTESKEDFADDVTLEKYTTLTRDSMKANVVSPEVTEPVPTNISGNPAMEYELRGTVDSMKVAYINTTVETPGHFHQIIAWTLRSRFDKNQAALREVTKTFREVAGARPPTSNVPSPTPSPTKPKGQKS